MVVGFGSVGFHWTLSVGWGLMDALPMIISAFVTSYHTFDVLCYAGVCVCVCFTLLYNVFDWLVCVCIYCE